MNPRRTIRMDAKRNVFVPKLEPRLDAIARAMLLAGKLGNPADYVILWGREILDGDGIFRIAVEGGDAALPGKPTLLHKSLLYAHIGGENARKLFWRRGRRVRDAERQEAGEQRLPDPPMAVAAPTAAVAEVG